MYIILYINSISIKKLMPVRISECKAMRELFPCFFSVLKNNIGTKKIFKINYVNVIQVSYKKFESTKKA